MPFVARFNRREAGGYDCVYGKGQKQLTAIMEKAGNEWFITEGFAMGEVDSDKKVSVVKAGWAAKAEACYGEVRAMCPTAPVSAVPAPPSLRPPSLKPAGGGGPPSLAKPPSLKPGLDLPKPDKFPTPNMAPEGAATCPHCHQPFHGWRWSPSPGDHKRATPPCRCGAPNPVEYMPDPLDFRMFDRDENEKFTLVSETGALDVIYHWMLRNREYCMEGGKLEAPWSFVQGALWRRTGYAEYRPELWQ